MQDKLATLQLMLEVIDDNVYLTPFSPSFSNREVNADQWQRMIDIITDDEPHYANLIDFFEIDEPSTPCLELSSFIAAS